MKCTGRKFIPNPLQGIWLEGRCSRDALPEKRVCDICEFSGLLGVIDDDVPDWLHMWGNKLITEKGISEANIKIILTSSNIAHMFADGIGHHNAPVKSVKIDKQCNIKKTQDFLIKSEKLDDALDSSCFKKFQDTFTIIENIQKIPVKMQSMRKSKIIAKKKPITFEFETAAVIKSHAACIGIHYVESDMDALEVSEIIYKPVKKEVINYNGTDLICYNDQGTYYECGPNGEIKGLIEINKK
jgi:hypothetical protein